MQFDGASVNRVSEHICDKASEILFNGRLEYALSGDSFDLGRALAEYFSIKDNPAERTSPELFALVKDAQKAKNSAAGSTAESEKRFYEGFKCAPEAYTDIYNCYFDKGIVKFTGDDIFVDAGAQDMFTSFRFAKLAKGRYSEIYAFEPDRQNHLECVTNLALFDDRTKLFPIALSDTKGNLGFTSSGHTSHIGGTGDTVFADTLDNCLAGIKPSFIKIHVEGGELRAIAGAENTIKSASPLIAVSIDHCPGDIVSVPLKLLEIDESYHFYIRHYSSSITETVLYAIK